MDENELDVKEVVTPAEDKKDVETLESEGDDKSKNFATLRKQLEAERKEKADLLKKLEAFNPDRGLNTEEPEDKKPAKADETLKVIFQRDVKEATKLWNSKNKVSGEEWTAIKSKVKLSGDETQSEISEKIQEAYDSLPSTRAKREEALINKGKRMAMQDFSDDEMDLGGGGDVDLGEGKTPHVDSKTKKWAKAFGMTDKDLKEVGDDDPNEWTVGKEATRKFFQP